MPSWMSRCSIDVSLIACYGSIRTSTITWELQRLPRLASFRDQTAARRRLENGVGRVDRDIASASTRRLPDRARAPRWSATCP